jgi:hypothetical protein
MPAVAEDPSAASADRIDLRVKGPTLINLLPTCSLLVFDPRPPGAEIAH